MLEVSQFGVGNSAPPRKGRVVNGQMAMASNKWQPPLPPPPLCRAMVSLAPGGWSVGQNALASRGSCPICLDTFSAPKQQQQQQRKFATGGYGLGDGVELTGSDGLAAATLKCGHAFCQR